MQSMASMTVIWICNQNDIDIFSRELEQSLWDLLHRQILAPMIEKDMKRKSVLDKNGLSKKSRVTASNETLGSTALSSQYGEMMNTLKAELERAREFGQKLHAALHS
jgi:hypothetical protein